MPDFVSPCLFGLEGPLANELRRLNLSNVAADNGRVSFSGDIADIARTNISLRCGERVLLQLGSFEACSFEELFQHVKALPWEEYISKNCAFPVKGHSLNSMLHSVPDCQKIIKKAVAERLGGIYGVNWLAEDGPTVQIQFSIMKDRVSMCLDTSGAGLHKRGYRPAGGTAPLRETLAAAMVTLSRYRGRETFRDLFCGSGTIPIEAALIAKNRAPGLGRSFAAQDWPGIDKRIWQDARDEAVSREFNGCYDIKGFDIDEGAVRLSSENAKRAGVDDIISFSQGDAAQFSESCGRGIIISNPPYGERLFEKNQAALLYKDLGKALAALESWDIYLLSPHTEFEHSFGRPADKKRKLYNGMIQCNLFMYSGRADKHETSVHNKPKGRQH